MAPARGPRPPKWRLVRDAGLCCSLLGILCAHMVAGTSGWAGCPHSQEIFATCRENSHPGDVITQVVPDVSEDVGVQWSLDGEDADWFFFDGKNLRLSTSMEKVLDREAQDPVLIAQLRCYEEDTLQSVFRILVQILNENDNFPTFAESIQSVTVSELTLVGTVIFSVQATDADNDRIIYTIDQTSPDAEYFKIEFPNSGEVVLSRPLDYETKTILNVTINAAEMRTAEHFAASTAVIITVLDGDDQYPQFLPCVLLLQDETAQICASPVYSANITEGESDVVLDFSPGPVHAVDGDKGLNSLISYAILSGNHDGRLLMDKDTGEVRLIRGVEDRRAIPALHLQVMAYQIDDPRKYTLASVAVRVLALNHFPPQFEVAEYQGFVNAGRSPASLVKTYGGAALMLRVQDGDFPHGINPMISLRLSPTSSHADFYHVSQEGLVIARADGVTPKEEHVLEVMAVDEESGDVSFATILVEVLPEGQEIPLGIPGVDRLTGCVVGKAMLLCVFFMCVLACMLSALSWLLKRHKEHRGPLERGCVAQGKHPNVSLQWFQQASCHCAMPHAEEVQLTNEMYGLCNPSFSPQDTLGTDRPRRALPPPETTAHTSFCVPTKSGLTPPGSPPSMPTIHRTTLEVDVTPTSQQPAEFKGDLDSKEQPPTTDQSARSAISSSLTCTYSPNVLYSTEKSASSEVVPMEFSLHDTDPITKQTPETSSADTCHAASNGETQIWSHDDTHAELHHKGEQPCTSLDDTEQAGHAAGLGDNRTAPQERCPSQQDTPVNSEGGGQVEEDEELESDEEELLRVLARLHPTFITWTK